MGDEEIKYEMLCSDVDGTLLNNDRKVSAANRNAVQDAIKAGKKVVLCSGRTWWSLKLHEEALGTHIAGQYGIGFNGGVVYEILPDGEVKLLFSEMIPHAISQEIFISLAQEVAKYEDICIVAYNHEGYLIIEDGLKNLNLFDEMKKMGGQVVPSFADEKGDMYKILLHGKNEDLLKLAKFCEKQYHGKCQMVFSAEQLLELVPMGVDKGRGVRFLAQHIGIDIASVITIGDEANDIEMLRDAGLGIAVANAKPSAIAAADIHLSVSNHDDAVAYAIRTYLLK